MPIQTREDLQKHLQWAITLEHTTIPLYLCALYSLKDTQSAAYRIIFSVVMEEMLHLCLACNLLNAIGGQPDFNNPANIPQYPTSLKHHRGQPTFHLTKCTAEVVRHVFMALEKPETVGALPEDDNFETIGQFYAAVELGLETLTHSLGEATLFNSGAYKQLTQGYFGGSGDLYAITDLDSARRAIHEIVDQGEGSAQTEYDEEGDLPHYLRFKELADGAVPIGAVWNMIEDPHQASIQDKNILALAGLFDDCYGLFLRCLQAIFNPGEGDSPKKRADLIYNVMLPLMERVMKPIAIQLMQLPINAHGETAGPGFQFSTAPQNIVLQNANNLLSSYPSLQDVVTSLEKLPLID